jgi:iron complex outermembrane receptor protein
LLAGALDLSLDADGLFESQVLDDPEGEIGSGGPRRTDNRSGGAGAGGRLVWRPNGRIALTAYTAFRAERYQPVDLQDGSRPGKEQSRDQLALALQAELTDPADTWLLQLALRRDLYWNRIQGDPYFVWSKNQANLQALDLTSPSVGLRYRASPTLSLQANAGRFYRVPTFYELFGDRGTAVGNPGLQPESGVNFDVGFIYRGEGWGPVSRPFFEYAYFQSRMDDLILFFQNSQRTIRAVNIGGAWIGGHELSFALTLDDDFRLSGNYTFQSAIDEGDVFYLRGNALPFRPMHEAYGRVGWTPLPALEGWVEASYLSGNYWDRANLYAVPDRRLYNAGATYTWRRQGAEAVSLTLEGKNLGNDRIADVAGYPLPGRSAFVTVQARWQ